MTDEKLPPRVFVIRKGRELRDRGGNIVAVSGQVVAEDHPAVLAHKAIKTVAYGRWLAPGEKPPSHDGKAPVKVEMPPKDDFLGAVSGKPVEAEPERRSQKR